MFRVPSLIFSVFFFSICTPLSYCTSPFIVSHRMHVHYTVLLIHLRRKDHWYRTNIKFCNIDVNTTSTYLYHLESSSRPAQHIHQSNFVIAIYPLQLGHFFFFDVKLSQESLTMTPLVSIFISSPSYANCWLLVDPRDLLQTVITIYMRA